jgi:phosphate transport system ATP-binding protein
MAEQNEFVKESAEKIATMPKELSNGTAIGTNATEPHIQKSHGKMSNTVIDIKDLNIYFGPTHAIKNVNMSIRQNSVTAIIGPSGCGKSTLLRTLNRMHEISGGVTMTGSVVFEGNEITAVDATELRRRIGMVFQKPNPFPTMSITENVVAGLRYNGVRSKSILRETAEKCLIKAGLWDEVKDRLKEPALRLSGGQQQRLCIARALAVSPDVLLMDEPASALDPISTAKIEELIFELQPNYTIVIVTHNMQQAARVSNETAFMYMGQLVEFGNTKDIFSNPKNKQTEEYITGRFG